MILSKEARDAKNAYSREWYARHVRTRKAYLKAYRDSHKREKQLYNQSYWEAIALKKEKDKNII